MSTTTSDVRYVDAAVTPAANYTGRSHWFSDLPVEQVQRPPLMGHVHVRISDRCIHNDRGPLCPPLTR